MPEIIIRFPPLYLEGWQVVESSVLGEAITLAMDHTPSERLPGGCLVYRVPSEVRHLAGQTPAFVRWAHRAKRRGFGRRGQWVVWDGRLMEVRDVLRYEMEWRDCPAAPWWETGGPWRGFTLPSAPWWGPGFTEEQLRLWLAALGCELLPDTG